jgi:hypothetical protein
MPADDNGWQRRSVRLGMIPEPALVDGVPDYLVRDLVEWLNLVVDGEPSYGGSVDPHNPLSNARQITRALRIEVRRGTSAVQAIADLVRGPGTTSGLFLDALDMSLHLTQGYGADVLEEILRQGGSAWSVAPDGRSLVRRVPEPEVAAFARATTPEDEATSHLEAAWSRIYGRHPDPDAAWTEAIKACEAIYIPIVEPSNRRATLGSTLRTLRSHSDQFDVRLRHNPSGESALPQLIEMLDVVWVDPNRHAGQPEPRHATIEDAENIVQLAVTLVGWGRTGILSRST